MTKEEKAIERLEGLDISAKFENDCVYVTVGSTDLELSEYEVNYQAGMYDEEQEEN